MGEILVPATDEFITRYSADLDAADIETLGASARAITGWLTARPVPFAVVHGDYRLDNLMFHPDGGDVVALDWQTVTVGPPAVRPCVLPRHQPGDVEPPQRRGAPRRRVPRRARRRGVATTRATAASTTTGWGSSRAR